MTEPRRRIRQVSRQATTAVKGYTEADVTWAEEMVIALMHMGVAFVDAVDVAARECSLRILNRKIEALRALQDLRNRQCDEARGQRPSLKTSLGDILAAKGNRL